MKYQIVIDTTCEDIDNLCDMIAQIIEPEKLEWIEKIDAVFDGQVEKLWPLIHDYASATRTMRSKKVWASKTNRCGNCSDFVPVDDGLTHHMDKDESDGICLNFKHIDSVYPPTNVDNNPSNSIVKDETNEKYDSNICEYFTPERFCPLCGKPMFIYHNEIPMEDTRSICRNCQIILPLNTPDNLKLLSTLYKSLKKGTKEKDKEIGEWMHKQEKHSRVLQALQMMDFMGRMSLSISQRLSERKRKTEGDTEGDNEVSQ